LSKKWTQGGQWMRRGWGGKLEGWEIRVSQ
jgi:hypothetical protein